VDLMDESMELFLGDLLNKIETMSASFYQQKNNQAYQEMVSVIDSLNIISTILEDNKEYPVIENLYNELTLSLNASMEAVENKDTILVADIFYYDIKGMIEQISELIV
jgi:hypothetical protein